MENKIVPRHVVMIPDGNRRWARERGEKPWVGHEKAAQNFEFLLKVAQEKGVEYFSIWGSSLENLEKRPLQEKAALLDIYTRYFKKLIDDAVISEKNVRIRVIGRWRERFPRDLVKMFEEGMEKTEDHTGFHLNIFLAYSGDDEMVRAIQSIAAAGVTAQEIDGDLVKSHLMTHDLPPVDYLIRTGGEPHLSVGFMMWDIANAQLLFTDELCPDFDGTSMEQALEEFARRGRRHGS